MILDKPYYPHRPIGSISVLAQTLGVHQKILEKIAEKVPESYTEHILPAHPSTGKIRTVLDPKHELKKIQKRINSRIFEKVIFPAYLQGGIKASEGVKRDYVENANIHGRSKTLINLDVKNFYPNIKTKAVRGIFKNFFNFSDEVVEILTTLTTYNYSLPQGGCSSSYLANLVFFNSEYRLVSSLRGRKFRYSRLLDDITISSLNEIDTNAKTKIITDVAAMLRKNDLSLKSDKTKTTDRSELHKDFEVTGLCVRATEPKITKKDRKYVRQMVFNCEIMAAESMTCPEYHTLWNKTSGLVAKLARLNHSQAIDMRTKLSEILPRFDDDASSKVIKYAKATLKLPITSNLRWGTIRRYNTVMYRLGILSRTNRNQARSLRKALKAHFNSVPTIKEFWEK